ncbi:CinA family protein [Agromyces archimandritae]|uniref:CinA family protein n=1 Tax=Agromyces archimandritae TaxID=2781962 RepID=A0A975FM79_9MICO|nr:CinA family protein [Agromyces archimandritae]QTX05025.1 CinA family protein [Agromyces archimandritae]
MTDVTAELVRALAERGWRAAVAESLTGGALAAEIVRIPGASEVFSGGIVAYATELKHTLLGVDFGLLAVHGPVDAEVARRMADGVRRAAALDGLPAELGIATTGVAGPDPQDGHPPGTVFVGIASPEGVRSVALELAGDRDAIRRETVRRAIEEARSELGPSVSESSVERAE